MKIKKILEVCKLGMIKKALDISGCGKAVRALENGQNVSQAKIDEMYANAITYEENLCTINYFKLKLNPDIKPGFEQKKQLLKDAIVAGIAKSRLEGKSHGVMKRLLEGRQTKEKTVDKLYNNLLCFFGYKITSKNDNTSNSMQNAPERIRSLEVLVSSLLKEVNKLKTEVEVLKKTPHKKTLQTDKTPRKIMGLTITLKTDKIRGKSYKRWYAIARKNGKRRLIYIGKDLSNAKTKITKGLERFGIKS